MTLNTKVAFPINFTKSDTPVIEHLRIMGAWPEQFEPFIVLDKETRIGTEKVPAGTVLKTEKIFDNYLIENIANQFDALPVRSQQMRKPNESIHRINYFSDIVDAIYHNIKMQGKDKIADKDLKAQFKLLDEAKEYLGWCEIVADKSGDVSILGDIKDFNNRKTRADRERANSKSYGEGNATFGVDISLSIAQSAGGAINVNSTLTSELYIGWSCEYLGDSAIILLQGVNSFAKSAGIMPTTTNYAELVSVRSNDKGLKFMSAFDLRKAPLKDSVEKFSGVLQKAYSGLYHELEILSEGRRNEISKVSDSILHLGSQ